MLPFFFTCLQEPTVLDAALWGLVPGVAISLGGARSGGSCIARSHLDMHVARPLRVMHMPGVGLGVLHSWFHVVTVAAQECPALTWGLRWFSPCSVHVDTWRIALPAFVSEFVVTRVDFCPRAMDVLL